MKKGNGVMATKMTKRAVSGIFPNKISAINQNTM